MDTLWKISPQRSPNLSGLNGPYRGTGQTSSSRSFRSGGNQIPGLDEKDEKDEAHRTQNPVQLSHDVRLPATH